MRPLKHADHRKFVETEGWNKTRTASSNKKTGNHFRYTLTLSTGDILYTRISHGSGQLDDAKLIGAIFRTQLEVTEENFYRCVEKGILPPRPQTIPERSAEGLDATLVRNLIRKVGLSQIQVAKMSKAQAVAAWNKGGAAGLVDRCM
jgi:hypothetical protein